MIDNPDFQVPNRPIFNHFDQEIVEKSVLEMEPSFIMDLGSLLRIRYLQSGFYDSLKDEKVFLTSLKNGISKLPPETKTLSNYMLKTRLLTIVDKCIERLE